MGKLVHDHRRARRIAYINLITWGIFGAVIAGLVAGLIIGQSTEYYTADEYAPTQSIAKQHTMGPATGILDGMSTGMLSAGIPVITIVIGIIVAYASAGGFTQGANYGLYGIGFAAVGMLATLGITLATDAYGPIADNAGGNAEMSHLPPEVRKRTDALDMLGNTTAATGKGFAIGSAALTAMALTLAYIEEVKIWIGKYAVTSPEGYFQVGAVKFYSKLPEGVVASDFTWSLTPRRSNTSRRLRHVAHEPAVLCGLFLAPCRLRFLRHPIKAVGRAAARWVRKSAGSSRSSPASCRERRSPTTPVASRYRPRAHRAR